VNIRSGLARWFFLAVVVAVACLGNVIAFENDVGLGSKTFALTAVNIFALSLLAFWFGGYEQRPELKAKLLIIGHAALMLAVGIGFVGWGYHGLRIEDCGFLARETGRLNNLVRWAIEHRACGWLSIALIVLGVYLLWPSAKLFYRLTQAFGRSHET
jgi:hypothetical protein